jgi:hypothetical protein
MRVTTAHPDAKEHGAMAKVSANVLGEELGFDLVTFQDHPYQPTEVRRLGRSAAWSTAVA